jgi:hypothetical protein
MSKRKLNLDELQVESFVTSFESDHDATVKGGGFIQKSLANWCFVKHTTIQIKPVVSVDIPCHEITTGIPIPGPRL